MSFYLIGLGLDKKSISLEALEVLKSCKEIYLETYTVNFPYTLEELEKEYQLTITPLDRQRVEDESLLKKAKDEDVALLVYGDSLSATTHMQLILECKKQNIAYKIFPNASIMTAIATTGLQPYKFGKVASMPNWKEHTNKPTSFADYIQENQSIGAHTLLLTDIGLEMNEAIKQLEVSGIHPEKIVVISKAGTQHQKIFFDAPKQFQKKSIQMPFCIIIPGKLHFIESEALDTLKSN